MAFYVATFQLKVDQSIRLSVQIVTGFVALFYVSGWVLDWANHLFKRSFLKTNSKIEKDRWNLLFGLVKLIVWMGLSVAFLQALEINLAGIITSLGISGVIVILAFQTVLADFFSAFVLFFEKPLQVGDEILFEEVRGVVEQMGLRTVTIHTERGEYLIVPNKNIVQGKIYNFNKVDGRKVEAKIRLAYDNTKRGIDYVCYRMQGELYVDDSIYDVKINLVEMAERWLECELEYMIHSQDYDKIMQVRQLVNLKILELLKAKKIKIINS